LIGQETLLPVEIAAKARIARRDERDWPAVAASLLLDCPIWTEDRDFFSARCGNMDNRNHIDIS
ncbi:PIN domain-containing protein, partial [Acidithiobacillus ferriphilus]